MDVRCDGCKWWEFTQIGHKVRFGICRLFPPMDESSDGRKWIDDNDWCGQWLSKDEPYPWEKPEVELLSESCVTCKHSVQTNGGWTCLVADKFIDESSDSLPCGTWEQKPEPTESCETGNNSKHRSLPDGKETTD